MAKLPHLDAVERGAAGECGLLRSRRLATCADIVTPYIDPANKSIYNQYTIRAAEPRRACRRI